MSEDKTFSFLKGLFVGAIAGAITGVLLTPKSGAETRKDMKKFALSLDDKITEIYNKAIIILQKKLDAIKKVGGKIDQTKYMSIVKDVVTEIQKDGTVTATAGQKIGELLRKDWTVVKRELSK